MSPRRRLLAGVAGAAVLIAVVTAFARMAGFGRTLVFSQTVGDNCLGTAYVTANMLPTILFEIVIGGALAGMVVPVLASGADKGQGEQVRQTASALVTWVVVIAVPLSLLLAAVSVPAMAVMLGPGAGCDRADLVRLAVRFLLVFSPQILFYGLAAVLYGILQAHRRFLAPALAPLVSSLVVMAAYIAFRPLGGAYTDDLAHLPLNAELTLSVGTTAGVAALFLTALVPTMRLRLGLRPRLSFPPGVARKVRSLAAAALLPLVAMQLSLLLAAALANRGGGSGAIVLNNYAWVLFTLPYGIIAVPIATSAFTTLAVRHGESDRRGFDRVLSGSARASAIITAALATGLAAAAAPVASLFAEADPLPLQRALLCYAPGIVGFGLLALLSRALYASRHGREAALAQVAGWGAVMVANAALVWLLPPDWTVAALGAGTSLGLTLAAVLLGAATLRAHGRAAFAGLGRGLLAVAAGAAAGYPAGAAVSAWSRPLLEAGPWGDAAAAVAAGGAAIAAFGALALLIDGRAVRAAVRRLRAADGAQEGPGEDGTARNGGGNPGGGASGGGTDDGEVKGEGR
ncbi:putative peptidoglycan lipid II flippase [Nocardiopsis mwathae]|uniref:Putative peptidoglycan lipid II flippase n=1 Tax=Nocardiopsis mwathae TaxID=1472723 RepID=A0A7W9YFB5_9ACTN|nr:lipid II flippase MurJ [Nocardiopsis mwathae]MBB6171114.1 putative peptidoglycan lipid II flippase [Nocardiopsis mwathae]